MIKKIALALLCIVFLTSNVCAIESYDADFNLIDGKIVVDVAIDFGEETTERFEFELPEDYKALSVYVDEEQVEPVVYGDMLVVDMDGNSRISFNYITKEFMDKDNFLISMQSEFDVDFLTIRLILPEGATLEKPISYGDLSSGSIFPTPDQATTDGKSMVFIWEREDFSAGEDLSIFAQIDSGRDFNWMFLFLVLILLGLAGYVYAIKLNKEETTRGFEKHLKEYEGEIVSILKNKEGSCEQGTLRVITGHSKAQLSRILKELEDRKVIHKEKRGKKNIIFLKEGNWNNSEQ